MTKTHIIKIFTIFALCILHFTLFSQYYWEFGQNKIQYKKFDWKVIDTEKFSIIYTDGGEALAKFALSILEPTYDSLKKIFNKEPSDRIPIIIYNSHNDFEQTNVTLSIIDENTGGFTEILKNRVVVPFDGSYQDFHHALIHEVVHVFQLSMRGKKAIFYPTEIYQPPLWMIEGMAEYFSLNWDYQSDMIIRDASYWGKIKPIQELGEIEGSYLMYKEGQSIIKFIANRYGEKKIGSLFYKMYSKNLNNALKSELGIDEEQLNLLWMKELKKEYWPICGKKDPFPEEAKRLTIHKGYTFNISPAISPDGSKIVFISDREEYENIYLMSSIDGSIKCRLITGGKSEGFESFHILHGGISWHPDGEHIVFVAKSKSNDVLYIMNTKKRKITQKITLQLDRIFSPVFSPDGKKIALRGVKDGFADIYILNIEDKEITQITNDQYDDITPTWTSDGKNIIFASDRPNLGEVWKYGKYTLFKINLSENSIKQLIEERSSSVSHPISIEDKILFIANYNGINNIYLLKEGKIYQITDVLGGVYTPSISKDGKFLTMSIYNDMGWDIFLVKNPTEKVIKEENKDERKSFNRKYTEMVDVEEPAPKKLGNRFTTDWVGLAVYGSIGSNSEIGAIGRLIISDLLGNHRIYIESASPQNIALNYYLSYFYLPKRIDIGVATYKEEIYYATTNPNIFVKERNIGGGMLLECPIDKYNRLEIESITEKFTRDWILYKEYEAEVLFREKYYSLGTAISYVMDNTIWGNTGPKVGERCKFSFVKTYPLLKGYHTYIYNLYKTDLRKYIRITKRYSFATRIISMFLCTQDSIYISIGGPEDLRGYDINELCGKNIGILNLEFRFPLIDKIDFAFPLFLSIRGIKGAMFCDLGYAVNDVRKLRVFENNKLRDLKFDFGVGIRFRFPYFVLKFDMAKNYDLYEISKQTYFYISLYPEF